VSDSLHSRRRVGLDAHLLSLTQNYRGAGINGHIYQLLSHLPATGAPFDYIAYLYDRAFHPPVGLPADAAGRMTVRRSHWDTRNPWRRIAWEQTRLAAESRRLDLLHGLAYAAPLAAACPTVVTVHDLSFLRFPSAFRRFNRVYLSWMTRAATRRAARVIAVSESTRQDVIRLCGVPAERVIVIPNGVSPEFCPADAADVAVFRRQKGLPDRYILFLGTLEPRKNLVRLVDAYAQWRDAAPAGCRAIKLVVAGGKGWFYEQVFARVQALGLTDMVLFPGFVPAGELPWWYRGAALFVYPSLFEGFGLPVIEAMACGTPAITSTASSLPEVAGDAALLVDPDDTAGLAAAIGQVLEDPATAARLAAAGPVQAAQFSWPRTAQETVALYQSVLRGPS
jgi:glycosyltransferase involved in cell wall biosynthesis